MGEFASKGVAGTGLGLGIAGTALGLLNGGNNNNCCGNNGGILGNLFGGNNCNNNCNNETKESAMLRQQVASLIAERYSDRTATEAFREANRLGETKEAADLRQQIASLTAERYSDRVAIDAYKEAVRLSNLNDEKMQANLKEVYVALADLDKKEAVNQTNIACMYDKLNSKIDSVHGEVLGNIKCLSDNTGFRLDALKTETIQAIIALKTETNNSISALRTETAQGIALEAERRQCGDTSIIEYVNGHFVPGKLSMPLSSICPAAKPLCDGTTGTTTETTPAA